MAQELESRRMGVYRLSDEERTAVRAGMDDARHGDFASEEEIEEFYQLHPFVIARSVATKQSILYFCCAMDCFAVLAMTGRERTHISVS